MRDHEVHAAVLAEVAAGLADCGLFVTAVVASPITGADGNREFLVRADRTGPVLDAEALAAVARAEAAA